MHSEWVTDMIKIATGEYHADWIINADADEFYYSKDLNLKTSILKYPFVTNYFIRANDIFPDDRDDFLSCPYFNRDKFCRKVIHKTKGFISIEHGNHGITMEHQIEIEPTNIVCFHYHVKNYKMYEHKMIKWKEDCKLTPKGISWHIKIPLKHYEAGNLKEYYDSLYGEEVRKQCLEDGTVYIDKSVASFLKSSGIV